VRRHVQPGSAGLSNSGIVLPERMRFELTVASLPRQPYALARNHLTFLLCVYAVLP
jgi:hypothetical protein